VTIADIKVVIACYFAIFAVLVILGTITQGRFYGAYLARYGDAKERRRRRPFFPVSLRGWSRPPRTLRSWFQPIDDPLVERRRRQHLLVWGGVALWFAVPLTLILYGSVFRR
jgi:hypothetical protein